VRPSPWTDLEQAFFDAAPPDQPAPAAAPERFDDLDEASGETPGVAQPWWRSLAAAWRALRRTYGRYLHRAG
jgi:hypothetical protein